MPLYCTQGFYTPGTCANSVQDGAGQLLRARPEALEWPEASGGVPRGPHGLGSAFQGNSQWKVAIRKCDAFELPVWFPVGGFHVAWHTASSPRVTAQVSEKDGAGQVGRAFVPEALGSEERVGLQRCLAAADQTLAGPVPVSPGV